MYKTVARFVPHVLKHEKVFNISFKTLYPQKLQGHVYNNYPIPGKMKDVME
jgi:hypothetical protein